jgi:hypothetical protein
MSTAIAAIDGVARHKLLLAAVEKKSNNIWAVMIQRRDACLYPDLHWQSSRGARHDIGSAA